MKTMWITLLAVAAILPATAQNAENQQSYVQVSGEATQEIVPDRFYLEIVINERDSKGKISVESQRRDMVAALKSLGIDVEKRLKVSNLSSAFYKKRSSLAMAQYQLELHSVNELTQAWQALDELGISQVNIGKVTHSEMERYKAEVRQAAIRNARDKAAALAEAIGQKIGFCFYIYDPNREITPVYYNRPRMMLNATKATYDAAVAEEEELEFRTLRLQYSVDAKFELK